MAGKTKLGHGVRADNVIRAFDQPSQGQLHHKKRQGATFAEPDNVFLYRFQITTDAGAEHCEAEGLLLQFPLNSASRPNRCAQRFKDFQSGLR